MDGIRTSSIDNVVCDIGIVAIGQTYAYVSSNIDGIVGNGVVSALTEIDSVACGIG